MQENKYNTNAHAKNKVNEEGMVFGVVGGEACVGSSNTNTNAKYQYKQKIQNLNTNTNTTQIQPTYKYKT